MVHSVRENFLNLPRIGGVLKKALVRFPMSLCAVLVMMYARIEESRYRSVIWMSYDRDRVDAVIEQGVVERLVMGAANNSLLCLASEQPLGRTTTDRITRPPGTSTT